MHELFLVIRKITIPPVFALLLLLLLYAFHPSYFGSIWQLAIAIFCLAVLPTLAYPMQKYVPGFKDKGREGQRTLAMLFSFVGYLAGTIVAFACASPIELKIIYLEYLLCGIGILVVNKVFKMKASGHACGVFGPVVLLIYFRQFVASIISAFLIVPVFIASVKTNQHTPKQLIGGSVIPFVTFCIVRIGVL